LLFILKYILKVFRFISAETIDLVRKFLKIREYLRIVGMKQSDKLKNRIKLDDEYSLLLMRYLLILKELLKSKGD